MTVSLSASTTSIYVLTQTYPKNPHQTGPNTVLLPVPISWHEKYKTAYTSHDNLPLIWVVCTNETYRLLYQVRSTQQIQTKKI